MTRRLPVFFLIDVSESMVGEPLESVKEGFSTILNDLRSDPYALETIWLSVTVYAGKTKTLVPLTELMSFNPPQLPVGGGARLGTALMHLAAEIESSTEGATPGHRGDWHPVVFLFTDAETSDDLHSAVESWKSRAAGKSELVVVLFGKATEAPAFSSVTERIYRFDRTDPSAYKNLFRWISTSLRSASVVGMSRTSTPLPEGTLTINNGTPEPESNYLVFLAKCANSGGSYLIKYEKKSDEEFRLIAAYPIRESYYELSDDLSIDYTLHLNKLVGFPCCPYPSCGNTFGFSICTCGRVFCSPGGESARCAWCEKTKAFDSGAGEVGVKRAIG